MMALLFKPRRLYWLAILVLTTAPSVNGFGVYLISRVGSPTTHKSPWQRHATVEDTAASTASLNNVVLSSMESVKGSSFEYADMFGLGAPEATCFAIFSAIRSAPIPLGLLGKPFVLRHDEITAALGQESQLPGFFTIEDLEKAVEDDFLDAARGSTDNRAGWKVRM